MVKWRYCLHGIEKRMLISHAKAILDRRLAPVTARWQRSETDVEEGIVQEMTLIQRSPPLYHLFIDGLSSQRVPIEVPLTSLHDHKVFIPHDDDPGTASALELSVPGGDPIGLLEKHGVDVQQLNADLVAIIDTSSAVTETGEHHAK